MTFDGGIVDRHEKYDNNNHNTSMVQPHIIEDDNDSAISEAVVSHTSKKPFNGYYN